MRQSFGNGKIRLFISLDESELLCIMSLSCRKILYLLPLEIDLVKVYNYNWNSISVCAALVGACKFVFQNTLYQTRERKKK